MYKNRFWQNYKVLEKIILHLPRKSQPLNQHLNQLKKTVNTVKITPMTSSNMEDASQDDQCTTKQLRDDQMLQDQVQERLQQLGLLPDTDSDGDESVLPKQLSQHTGQGKKSGRLRTTSHIVRKHVEWPHFHIFRGGDRAPVEYDSLTISEFVLGYTHIVRTAEKKLVPLLLIHLTELMSDTAEYSWESVRNFHGILLQKMEMSLLTWYDQQGIQELRRVYAQRTSYTQATVPTSVNPKTGKCCQDFQTGKCAQPQDHRSAQGWVRHACIFCHQQTGYFYNHPQRDCRRLARNNTA